MKKQSKTERALSHKVFLQREYGRRHLAYEKELEFYDAVKDGNFKTLNKIMLPLKDRQLGILSKDSLRNAKYHLVITVALITRFCIEGGLESETAYTLSDLYIQQIDTCRSEEEIDILHRELVFDFADRMKKLKSSRGISRAVKKACDYIYDNLHRRLTLDKIAKAAGIHKNYLCSLFKKETGSTVQEYIRRKKIEAAANMLSYADYSPQELSDYFSFSSQSHFTNTFKSIMKLTPSEYRRTHYRAHWQPEKSEKY